MRRITLILISIFSFVCNGQTKLRLFGKLKAADGVMLLRIVAPGMSDYHTIMKRGITVTRCEIVGSKPTSTLNIKSGLKPTAKNDTLAWMNFSKLDKNTCGFVYNALYPPESNKTKTQEEKNAENMTYSMLMMACNFDKRVANACGLFVADSTADDSKEYVYRLTTKLSNGTEQELLSLKYDPLKREKQPVIKNFEGKCKGKTATLSWNARILTESYSGFYLERSSDSISFIRLNDAPHILVTNQFDKSNEKIFCTDTFQETDQTYYYRIKGVDHFGDESAPSNVIKLRSHRELSAPPFIDSLKVVNNSHVQLRWSVKNETPKEILKGYIVQTSRTVNKNFSIVHAASECYFTDSTVESSRYYRVGAITYYNDTIYSESRLAVITDTIPPDIPAGIKAVSDKKGNVVLTWRRCKESNLKGYKIFRSNSLYEEFVQLNSRYVTDTLFSDKIDLNNLSSKVYYSVAAVDQNFNNSPQSIPYALKRPDTIPPPRPVIFSVQLIGDKVCLRIVPGLSEDIERHLVYRKTQSDFELIGGFNSKDSVYYFCDTLLPDATVLKYKVGVIDESWNTSESNEITAYLPGKLKKKIESVQYSVDRIAKNISISWNYHENNINRFVIYRSSDDEPLTIIKTLEGDKESFIDNNLSIGNNYEYRIKAVFTDDRESLISDAIKVVY